MRIGSQGKRPIHVLRETESSTDVVMVGLEIRSRNG